MHISLLGSSGVKLQVKSSNEDVQIIIDPYEKQMLNPPRSLSADIALFTRGEAGSISFTNEPFILSTPGECEVKGVLIYAKEGEEAGTGLVRINAEDMSVGHLGLHSSTLNNAQLEMLNGVDILLLPVGGGTAFGPAEAAKAVSHIEPRVVIPYAFQSAADSDASPVSAFVKELGLSPSEEGQKVIIKKRDLPQEHMQLLLLELEG